MPHISLVFREIWDTTDVDRKVHRMNVSSEGRCSGIPHLAINERDMGHPALVRELEAYSLRHCVHCSAQEVCDRGHHDLLLLERELGKDRECQDFRRRTLTLRKGPWSISQAEQCGLLMERQRVVNL